MTRLRWESGTWVPREQVVIEGLLPADGTWSSWRKVWFSISKAEADHVAVHGRMPDGRIPHFLFGLFLGPWEFRAMWNAARKNPMEWVYGDKIQCRWWEEWEQTGHIADLESRHTRQ